MPFHGCLVVLSEAGVRNPFGLEGRLGSLSPLGGWLFMGMKPQRSRTGQPYAGPPGLEPRLGGNGDVGCHLLVFSACWWQDQVQEVHLRRVGARGLHFGCSRDGTEVIRRIGLSGLIRGGCCTATISFPHPVGKTNCRCTPESGSA